MKTVAYTAPVTGATVTNATVTFDNQGLITAASSGSAGATITTQEEGVTLSTTVTTLDFTGAAVTASGGGASTTVNVAGVQALVSQTTAVAIANNAAITWNTTNYDGSSMFDGSTKITVPRAGRYIVTYSVGWNTASASQAQIAKNGTGLTGRVSGGVLFGASQTSTTAILNLAASDYITILNTSGSSRTTLASLPDLNYFHVALMV